MLIINQPNHPGDLEQTAELYRQQFARISQRAEQIRAERSNTTTEADMPPDPDLVRKAAEADPAYLHALAVIVADVLKPAEREPENPETPKDMEALSEQIWNKRRATAPAGQRR